MSINTLKKKSARIYGRNHSAGTSGAAWLHNGALDCCGAPLQSYGGGFSINGGRRSSGYIGKSSAFSTVSTPYRGVFPKGNGGNNGGYRIAQTINATPVNISASQATFIKPSTISYKTKYRVEYNNESLDIVAPYGVGGNANFSQSGYIQNLTSANDCVNDINNPEKYLGVKSINSCAGVATGVATGVAGTKSSVRGSGQCSYVKSLNQAISQEDYINKLKRLCGQDGTAEYNAAKKNVDVCFRCSA